MGTGDSFTGVRRPEREANHWPPSSAEVNMWSYTSTLPYTFVAWCLVKHRDSFTFTLGPTQLPIQRVPGTFTLE